MRWLKTVIVAMGASLLLAPAMSAAQDGMVKIGVLDDMSGPYSDNTGPWDLAKIISTIPGEQAFRPLSEGGCPLVKK